MAAHVTVNGDGGDLGALEQGPEVLTRSGPLGWLAAHPNTAYVIRRLLIYIFTLWASITAAFFFFHLIPGNPISAYVQNLATQHESGNTNASQIVVEHYKKIFGLQGGILNQYWHFLVQLVHFNWGPSLIQYPQPAWEVVRRALPWTIGLLLTSTIIAWILGTIFGAIAGWRHNKRGSRAATWLSVAVGPVPFYFIAIILVFLLAYKSPIFPVQNPYGVSVNPGLSYTYITSLLYHAILPAVSIVFVGVLANLLNMRQQTIMVVGEDYLSFAEAKGLGPWRMLVHYAMPNCYLPQITGLVMGLGGIFGGNVILENLFNYPGVGNLLVQAIHGLDFGTVLCITDISIFGVLTAVFILDLIMPLLDPRITYTGRS